MDLNITDITESVHRRGQITSQHEHSRITSPVQRYDDNYRRKQSPRTPPYAMFSLLPGPVGATDGAAFPPPPPSKQSGGVDLFLFVLSFRLSLYFLPQSITLTAPYSFCFVTLSQRFGALFARQICKAAYKRCVRSRPHIAGLACRRSHCHA